MEKEITLAGGCFWGTEALLERIPGVLETTAGYANSKIENPSYELVCSGKTGAAEAVFLKYNSELLPLKRLLEIYFRSIDPTSFEKQGGDIGNQYRTGIYYVDDNDLSIIRESFEETALKYEKPIVTEIFPLKNFYPAEEYHQDYLSKNPNGYCHVDLRLLKEFNL